MLRTQVGREMPLVSRENHLVRVEAIIPQKSEGLMFGPGL